MSRSRWVRSSTSASVRPRSDGAAPRAGLDRIGVQEDLHGGVGRDHRADVAALGDPVALGDDRLLLARRAPHARPGRRRPWRPAAGHAGGADLGRHVAAVDRHPLAWTSIVIRLGESRGGVRQVFARNGEADAAVHRPRVQVREAEPLGGGACDRGLSGPGGTVDGDDHVRKTNRNLVGYERHSCGSVAPRDGLPEHRELRATARSGLGRAADGAGGLARRAGELGALDRRHGPRAGASSPRSCTPTSSGSRWARTSPAWWRRSPPRCPTARACSRPSPSSSRCCSRSWRRPAAAA